MSDNLLLATIFTGNTDKSFTEAIQNIKDALDGLVKKAGSIKDVMAQASGAVSDVGQDAASAGTRISKGMAQAADSVRNFGQASESATKRINYQEQALARAEKAGGKYESAVRVLTRGLDPFDEKNKSISDTLHNVGSNLSNVGSRIKVVNDELLKQGKTLTSSYMAVRKFDDANGLLSTTQKVLKDQTAGTTQAIIANAKSTLVNVDAIQALGTATEKNAQVYGKFANAVTNLQKRYTDGKISLESYAKGHDRIAGAQERALKTDKTLAKQKADLAKQYGHLTGVVNDNIKALDKGTKTYETVQSELKGISAQTAKADADQKKLAESSVKLNQAQTKLYSQYPSYRSEIANINSELQKGKLTKEQAAFAVKDLGAKYAEAAPKANIFSSAVSSVAGSLKSLASYGAAAAILTTITLGFREGLKEIIAYDQALRNLQAIIGASEAQAAMLGTKMREVAKETKFSTAEVADGMVLLGQAGLDTSEVLYTIRSASLLATGTLSDMALVTDLFSSTLRAYALDAIEASRISDVMANAVNKSKLTVEKLRVSFNYVGATARMAGVSIEESAAAMGILANAGLRASTIGTGFRQVLSRLLKPNAALVSALKETGTALSDLDPATVGFENVLQNLSKILLKTGTNTVDMSKAFTIFGLRGAQSAATLVDAFTKGGYQKMLDNIAEVGATERMAALQAEGLEVKLKNLSDRAKLVALAIGDAGFTGALKAVVSGLQNVVGWVGSFLTYGDGIVQQFALATAGAYLFVKSLIALQAVEAIAWIGSLVSWLKIATVEFIALARAGQLMATAMGWLTGMQIGLGLAATAFTTLATAVGFFGAALYIIPMAAFIAALATAAVGAYRLVTANQRSAKAAADAAEKYSGAANSLNAFKKVFSDSLDEFGGKTDKSAKALERFIADFPELAQEIRDTSKELSIMNMSQAKLTETIEKVELKKLSDAVDNYSEVLVRNRGVMTEYTEKLGKLEEEYGDNITAQQKLKEQSEGLYKAGMANNAAVEAAVASYTKLYEISQKVNADDKLTAAGVLEMAKNRGLEGKEIREVMKAILNLNLAKVKETQITIEYAQAANEAYKTLPDTLKRVYAELNGINKQRFNEELVALQDKLIEYEDVARKQGIIDVNSSIMRNLTDEEVTKQIAERRQELLADLYSKFAQEGQAEKLSADYKISEAERVKEAKIQAIQDKSDQELILATTGAAQIAALEVEAAAQTLQLKRETADQMLSISGAENEAYKTALQGLLDAETELGVKKSELYTAQIEEKADMFERAATKEIEDAEAAAYDAIAVYEMQVARNQITKKAGADAIAQIEQDLTSRILEVNTDLLSNMATLYHENSDTYKSYQDRKIDAQRDAVQKEIAAETAKNAQLAASYEEDVTKATEIADRKIKVLELEVAKKLITAEDAALKIAEIEEDLAKTILEIRQQAVADALVTYGADAQGYIAAVEKKIEAETRLAKAKTGVQKAENDAAAALSNATEATEDNTDANKDNADAAESTEGSVTKVSLALDEESKALMQASANFKTYLVSMGGILRLGKQIQKNLRETTVLQDAAGDAANTLSDDMLELGKAFKQGLIDNPDDIKAALESMLDTTKDYLQELQDEWDDYQDKIAEVSASIVDLQADAAEKIKNIQNNALSDEAAWMADKLHAESLMAKARQEFEKGNYEVAQKYYAAAQEAAAALAREVESSSAQLQEIQQNAADSILDIERSMMSQYDIWTKDRLAAYDLIAQAQTAMAEGNYDLVASLTEQAIALAETLSTELTDSEGEMIASLDETSAEAIDLITKASNLASDAIEANSANTVGTLADTSAEAISLINEAEAGATASMEAFQKELVAQQASIGDQIVETEGDINSLEDELQDLIKLLEQQYQLDIDIDPAIAAMKKLKEAAADALYTVLMMQAKTKAQFMANQAAGLTGTTSWTQQQMILDKELAGTQAYVDALLKSADDLSKSSVNVSFTGSGSTTKPINEKLQEITGGLKGLFSFASKGAESLFGFKGDVGSGESSLMGATASAKSLLNDTLMANSSSLMSSIDTSLGRSIAIPAINVQAPKAPTEFIEKTELIMTFGSNKYTGTYEKNTAASLVKELQWASKLSN